MPITKNNMIIREAYLQHIEVFTDHPLIKVITEIRRSGRSSVLKLFLNRLISKGIKEDNIIYINFKSMIYSA